MQSVAARGQTAALLGGTIPQARDISAYCGPNGVIHFGPATPKHSVEIVRGPEGRVRRYIDIVARHGYDKGLLLVPGMPEADDENAARAALKSFVEWASANAGADRSFVWNRNAEAML
ncbi:hypothetical protein ACFJGW_00690 [Burkholderiaceae bacterium UC74_6]